MITAIDPLNAFGTSLTEDMKVRDSLAENRIIVQSQDV